MSTNRWRNSSLLNRLIPHAVDCAECGESASGGPNIISAGHQNRFTASCAMSCWAGLPCERVCRISKPCRWWKDSSLQMRTMARPYGPYAQRHLVHDRRAVHKPADRAHVGPGQGRIVEDRRVLLATRVQLVQQVLPIETEGLGGGVQVQPVTGLVLHLGDQDGLAPQARRAGDPIALRLHADDLRVRVLGDLPDERLAVALGHPVPWLDALLVGDQPVELLAQSPSLRFLRLFDPVDVAVHTASLPRLWTVQTAGPISSF